MLLLMWLAGCTLVAIASAALSEAEGPWFLGFAAIMAAQVAVLAGRTAWAPAAITWPLGFACVSVYAFGYGGDDPLIFLGLVAVLMVVVDRFAALSVGLSAFLVREGGAGTRALRSAGLTPPDPIARDFARARRERSPLAVASISVPETRESSRRLARIARELVPRLRMTDAIVRVAPWRVVVVLPGADSGVAMSVLGRAPAGARPDVLLGIAAFPEDGQTFASLKEVARSRERPWPRERKSRADLPSPGLGPARPPAPQPVAEGGTPAVLFEARPLGCHLRRVSDLIALAVVAPLVVPLVALLAIAVKLDSPGPAVIRIKRLGRDGRPFDLFKLRSMTRDADRMKEELKHLNTLPWPDFKIVEDPRVTRVGRLLRRYSLDELPQLYNVLRGEMTLVGPRPCSVALADYDLWQSERLDVTPGLVGRWQAEGRGSVDFAERCRLDIRQVRSRSIRVNLALLLATLRSVFASRGAY
jgi:lipopolysaccharide/colanic/teichoic acid biosynthesis glycosyltransferase